MRSIFNSEQGGQIASLALPGVPNAARIAISMAGRGAWRHDVFVERRWRTIKCDKFYLTLDAGVSEARGWIGRYLVFHNTGGYTRAVTAKPQI